MGIAACEGLPTPPRGPFEESNMPRHITLHSSPCWSYHILSQRIRYFLKCLENSKSCELSWLWKPQGQTLSASTMLIGCRGHGILVNLCTFSVIPVFPKLILCVCLYVCMYVYVCTCVCLCACVCVQTMVRPTTYAPTPHIVPGILGKPQIRLPPMACRSHWIALTFASLEQCAV